MIAALQHRTGETIQDRYEVLGILGSGAFGTVYRCRDHELNTLVAIKELHVLDNPDTGVDERGRALDQFRAEALHLSNLRHPHIVSGHYQPHSGTWLVCPVCGYAFRGTPTCPEHNARPLVLKQRYYLVMEFLDGPSLSQAAEQGNGTLFLPKALRYIRQTAEALKLIHSRGWIHRDVKPENIRIRAAGDEAVLLDFGIATASGASGDFTTRAQRHTHGGGTLGYAPESPQERRHPDSRSDIHALGMTLYRLLSGRDPLEVEDLVALRKHTPRYFDARIPQPIEELILRSISSDPAQRPRDGGEFLRELDEIENPKPVAAPPPVPVTAPVVAPPKEGLHFSSGEYATTLEELVTLCDRYPRDGQELLFRGEIENFLFADNREILARRAREVRGKYKHRARGLEAFLQATGEVQAPQLTTNVKNLDYGQVAMGEQVTCDLRLRNNGRGHLFGVVRSSHPCVHVPAEFDGNDVKLVLTLDTRGLKKGLYSGDVTIDSSAGELHIPFRVEIKESTDGALSTVVFWSALGMLGGFAVRTLPLVSQSSNPGWVWLSPQHTYKYWPAGPLFGVCLLAALAPIVAGESLRRRSCSFALSLGLFATLFSMFCGMLGLEILIGGDGILKPLLQELTKHWAAGAWMFLGGIIGASYGTLRRWNDIFSKRLVQILMGWLTSMAILYGLLAAAQLLAPIHP